jgi:hypothetical protein
MPKKGGDHHINLLLIDIVIIQMPNDCNLVLPHFRGHTIIVVEIQQEVFHDKK